MCALMSDISLSILGREREKYIDYAKRIREEYSIIKPEDFIERRVFILKKFLARDSIYYNDQIKDQFEKQARENIEFEIEHLSSKGLL